MPVPTTSKTLLRDLGADARSPRWAEFVVRYRPMMESFLAARYPSLAQESDDLVQETLLALLRALPDYRYVPDEQGSFHNYLTGILRNKAASLLRRRAAESGRDARAAAEPPPPPPSRADEEAAARDEEAWRDAVLQIALRQLLADESVQERTKQVFVRVAVEGEDPAAVAAAFGVDRNAVDQMKSRMTRRLRELVAALDAAPSA